jgi:putative YjhG/YagF family dehydratase
MALAGVPSLPAVAVPGGVTLLARDAENTATVQTLSARFARGEITLDHASVMGCRACGSAGGGCQFMGTAATSQVVAEALGLALPHSALSPSGTDIWSGMHRLAGEGLTTEDILTDDAIHNAMVLHAAVGGSTNLLLHIPAIAHAAGLDRPRLEDWVRINAAVPRLVDALPNGPQHFATVQVFLAGGVPEVMLQLAGTGALRLDARTVSGRTLGDNLEWWATSERRRTVRARLAEVDGIDPDDVIRPLDRRLPSTVTFLTGSIAPGGAIVKSTAIAPHLLDEHGAYRHRGAARVFTTEDSAIDAIKRDVIVPGEVLVLIGLGPGIGMPETYQITAALKAVDPAGRIPLITDGRFSGVSTGPCIGHISPEAWAGGPIGRLRDGDVVDIVIDTAHNTGHVDVLGTDDGAIDRRPLNARLVPDTRVPDDTRLWAALQAVGGGSWGGCVYDVDRIVEALHRADAPASTTETA